MREAQEVIAHADSLREAHLYAQNEYDDSLSLAQAYETLKEIPLPFRGWLGLNSSYAHACYHYGRMLRAKDNHLEAMKVFIKATHSRTRDYRILGRIYNNMGDMAHLAGDYALSYDMFAISADCFLQNGDTINYYYGLNDMAFRLAEQGKKEETLVLLDSITRNCNDKNVILKTWETKAEVYRKISQYDSTLYYSNKLIDAGYIPSFAYMLKAWALEHTGKKDSAVWYAKYIMQMPSVSVQEQYNMLYILSNYDTTLTKEEVLELSAQRADLGFDVLDPLHTQYTMAVEILQKDLHRIPKYVYVLLVGIVLLFFILGLIYYAKKIKQEKLQQENILQDFQQQKSSYYQQRAQEIERKINILQEDNNWQHTIQWKKYDSLCRYFDEHFFLFSHKLQERQILNEKEIRLCFLVVLGRFSDKQLASILCYGEKSIRGIKRRTAQKLGTTSAELRVFLHNVVLDYDKNE